MGAGGRLRSGTVSRQAAKEWGGYRWGGGGGAMGVVVVGVRCVTVMRVVGWGKAGR